MVNLFTPPKDAEDHVFFPFGPVMGYKKLSLAFVEKMNSFYDTKAGELNDYSANLVGKVKQELQFNDPMRDLFVEEVKNFIGKYNQTATIRNSYGHSRLNTEKFDYSLQFISGWLVRQFNTEYNPVHLHTNCRMSCVGYLKLPEGIEKEWEEDYKDHHPSHGHIQFVNGSAGNYSATNFMVKPQVGDFYVFPSDLFHCVYPFYTEGERRSFSANFNFIEIAKRNVQDEANT
tara:strand:+ start:1716 stop:2408 length:693 start_codon:yes stop_codon:yes gene_type:complete